jgi:hypothetical protein
MKGKRTFDQVSTLDKTVLSSDGERIGVVNFDVNLFVMDKSNAPFIQKPKNGDMTPLSELEEFEKFDLETIVPKVTHDEMVQLMRGVNIRDIFAQRREEEEEFPPVKEVSKETVSKKVASLFDN